MKVLIERSAYPEFLPGAVDKSDLLFSDIVLSTSFKC